MELKSLGCRPAELRLDTYFQLTANVNGIIADWIANLERIISQSSGGCEDAHNSPDSVHGHESSSLLDPLLLLQLARFVVV